MVKTISSDNLFHKYRTISLFKSIACLKIGSILRPANNSEMAEADDDSWNVPGAFDIFITL